MKIVRTALAIALMLLCVPAVPVRADLPPVKVGFIFSFAGFSAPTGKLVLAAIAAYQRQHGETAAGRKIELIVRDDTGIAPEVATRLAQELILQEHVDFLAGAAFTPNAIAIAHVSTAAHVPFLIVNAGTSGIIEKEPYSVRFGFTNVQLTEPMAKWAIQNGIKTAYAIYQNYGPGAETTALFAKAFAAQGGTLLGQIGVPVDATDYSAYVQRIKDAAPQGVFAFINGGPGVQFLRSAALAGFAKSGIKIFSAVELVSTNDLPIAGDSAVGTASAIDYMPENPSPLNRAFVAQFEQSYGSNQLPDFMAVSAYDVLGAIYRVVAAQKGVLETNKTMDLLRNMSFESPRGPIRVDPRTRGLVENIYVRQIVRSGSGWAYRQIAVIPMVKDTTETGDP
jgi:branched-chain amino acid transport system substrate-binding protein